MAWNGQASNYSDAAYERACVLDRKVCGSDAPPKTRCSLPIRDPDGKVNEEALGQAAARLDQVVACPAAKSAAAAKLRTAYKEAGKTPPDSLKASVPRMSFDELRGGARRDWLSAERA